MSKLNVILVSRFPKLDVLDWKKDLIDRLSENDFSLSIIYSCTDFRSYAREGIRRYGTDFLHELAKIIGSRFRRGKSSPGIYGNQTLSQYARQRNIPVYFVRQINSRESYETLSGIGPDIAILLGAEIVRKEFLNIPRLGTINPHFALLPKYRGMSTIEWSIFHGDKVGTTIHFVEPRIDTGDILNQGAVDIEKRDILKGIREKVRQKSVELLTKTCLELMENRASPIKQRVEDGKQFFVMHPEIREIVEKKLCQNHD
jgi:methionyl-tRNA formyltransferase